LNNMNLVIIFGPPAVGKMTVAQELAKITGIKVFHNHMTIDLLTKFFEFGSEPFTRLTKVFRHNFIEEAAKHNVDLAFSVAWDFKHPHDTEEMHTIKSSVEKHGGTVYFVELEAPLEVRLSRNKSENRLKHKDPHNVQAIEKNILDWDMKYQLNSRHGQFPFPENYLRIDIEHLSAADAAQQIKEKFSL
jgi:tRNA uridine 5-carbamoylmethylation protein Kti12